MLERLVESAAFRRTVIALILINAVMIGMETYPGVTERYGGALHLADRVILVLFTIEILLRFAAARSKEAFFRDGWHWFDMLVVAAGWVPGSQFLSVVRIFRVLRVLRAITVLPNLQRLVGALLRSLPSLGNIVLLLGLLLYVYAAAGTFLYGRIAPEHFGTLHDSVLTLFAVITLEGWVDVMRAVRPQAPMCWAYFVSFILFGTFVALNFFVGVIVGNMQRIDAEDKVDEMAEVRAALARIEAKLTAS